MNINNYIDKLMENLPKSIVNIDKPTEINLILGGGAFNGVYILGALYFLKEMERKKYIIVKKISTCSISSLLALLYLTDNLDKANELYFDIINHFKKRGNLSNIFSMKPIFKEYLSDENINKSLDNKLYICYNNIKTYKKCVISKYKNFDHLFEMIIRSCFVPFIINYKPSYKYKYIDGMVPHFLSNNKKNTQTIYLDVYTFDKIEYSFNIKNENNNYHRIFEGIIDIHKYFIKNRNTTMCSNVDKWNLKNYIAYFIYLIVERIMIYFISYFSYFTSIFKYKYDKLKPIISEIIKYYLVNPSL